MTKERLSAVCDQILRFALMAMLLVVPIVFFTFTHDVFEINKLTAFRMLTLVAALAYMTQQALVGGFRLRSSPLWPPVILIGLSSLASTLITNNFTTSFIGVYEDFEGILTILNYLLLWFLVHQSVRTLRDARHYLAVMILAGVVIAGYGLAQYCGIDFVMWNPLTFNAARFFSTMGNPNFLAAVLLMVLPIAMIWFLTTDRPKAKILLLLAVGLMGLVIFFTKSRGAFFALVAEALFFAAYLAYDHRRQGSLWSRNRVWLVVLSLVAGMTLFAPSMRASITDTVTRAVQILDVKHIQITPRLYMWRSALQMIRDKPWLGNGLDTFQLTFPKYRLPEYWFLEWNGTPEKAHSFFLQIGATTGLLGLGAWLWLLAAFFTILWKQQAVLPASRRYLSVGIGIAQIGFLAQNQFNFTVVGYGSLFWFLLALGPVLPREESEPASETLQEPFSLAQVSGKSWLAYLAASGFMVALMLFSMRLWVADVFFKRGIVLLSQGLPEQSIPELARAVATNPQMEIYWVKYGIAFEEAAKRAQQKEPLLKQAAEIHKFTIGINPLNGYDFNNLGRVYKYWGDFLDPKKLELAEANCRKASELDPYNVYFALDLASIHLAQKRWQDAAAIADRLIKFFPDFAVPYSYKGYIALMAQDQAAAYSYFKLASQKDWKGDVTTQATTLSNLGIVSANRGELEAACEAFDGALRLRPDYLEARLNRALILEQRGLYPEALNEYHYLVQQAPQYPGVAGLRQKIEKLERRVKP